MLRGVTLSLLLGPLRVEPVPAELAEALLEAQVTVTAGQRSGFQLRFALAKEGILNRELLPGRTLDPPNRVILVATVDGEPHVLMDGVVTRHDLAPGNEAGQSTLTVTGVDVSQMMDLIDLTGLPLPAMPPEARVLLGLAPFAAYGVRPLVVPSVLLIAPNPLWEVPGWQGTTYQYLSQLAEEVGYVFYVEPGSRPGLNTGYWGPEIRTGQPQRALSVNLDAATNVESLSFSFDGLGKKVYLVLGSIPQTRVPIPIPVPDISPINPPLGRKIPIPLSYTRINAGRKAAPGSSRERRERDGAVAKWDILRATSQVLGRAATSANVIGGSGSLDVLRYGQPLRARRLVAVRGAGPAYDGEYYVTSVSSTLKPGEFKQRFTLSRNAQVSISETVRP